jgi:hypothetical protein
LCAAQTDLRSMILRMKYWQPVAVRTLVAERHSYARWRPGYVALSEWKKPS